MMQRFDPFRDLRRMEETMNRIWRGFGTGPEELGAEDWGIAMDVVEEGDNLVVHASLPGVKPDDIQVSVDDDILTIRGHTSSEQEHREGSYLMRERRSGAFYRSLRLPDTVDADKAKSTFQNGVLTITFHKQEGKKPKQLKVDIVE